MVGIKSSAFGQHFSAFKFVFALVFIIFYLLANTAFAQDNDSCEAVTAFSEFGIIGDTQFEYGNGSTINGNNIDGEGNTPTPSGSVTTVPTEFPLFEPLQFPSNLVGGPDRTNQTNIPPGSYGKISADGNDAFTSFSGGTYYIEELEIDGNNATIQFAPGDYFIEEIDMANNSYITIFPAGLVRIFIKDEIEGKNNIFINSGGNPANLIIYLYDGAEVDIGNYNQGSGVLNFSGSIYSPYEDTEIEFGNNNNIEGSIVSAGEVEVGNNTNFTYTLETQQQILEAFGCAPEDAEILYFQVRRPSSLVSCYTAAIEIRACANADCTELFEDTASVELSAPSASAEWVNGDIINGSGTNTASVGLTNGIGIVGLQNITGGNTGFSISASTPNAVNPTQCFDSTGTTSGACAVDFRTAGLLFVEGNNFSAIPDDFAGVDFPVALRAVETNLNTGACEARVEGPQTVNMGVECVNPANCIAGQTYSVGGTDIGLNNAGNNINQLPVSLTFDANGVALLPHNYSDVGLLRLHASLSLPAEPNANNPDINDPPVTLEGSSLNEFVIKPHTLIVQALDSNDDIWDATTDSGSGFQAAGSAFSVIIQSQNANGNATPNFGNESPAAGVLAAFDSVAFPTGGEAGNLNFTQGFVPDAGYPGAQRSNSVTWSEVGTVNFVAQLIGNDYLGGGDAFSRPPSPVGRFFPDRFVITDSAVTDACILDEFSYMGQPDISITATLNAVNVFGDLTQNYGRGNYIGSAGVAAVAANTTPVDVAADEFNTRFNIDWPAAWVDGEMIINEPEAVFERLADNSPDGPFDSVKVGLQIINELDSRGILPTDLVTLGGDATMLTGELNLRYGRLVLENIAGPEDEDLAVIMQAEYWNGDRFMLNDLDNCTANLASSLGIISNPDNLSTAPGGDGNNLENGDLVFGDLFWQAANAQGEFKFEYVAPPWLQFPWVDNEGDSYLNPRAFGSFGQYRGNDRVIYWLELR
ncbi:hypothetical protein A28LD_1915 [Idiomarina sp. A28L]|uniref:DUF6701 domain-containing protein n=1 Tax=Idiomarina sp. A28L TaxID=1036674 RepID=UPI00021388C0|nr:DUF6701 domain-containing protein [Idiomarina sp. A28L]EGN74898.1 hypothetical protein A28LD_1915 [Idiomarina sp. A28L]